MFYMTQVVANLLKSMSLTFPNPTNMPKSAAPSSVARDNEIAVLVSEPMSSRPLPEIMTDPGLRQEGAVLKYDLKLFKTETKHQIEKLEGEIEGFEEEIASRDHQILEQEEQILEQNQRINALNEILQERKESELELEEAERILMDAIFDLITQRTYLKRKRKNSEEDEILPCRRKRRVEVDELQ